MRRDTCFCLLLVLAVLPWTSHADGSPSPTMPATTTPATSTGSSMTSSTSGQTSTSAPTPATSAKPAAQDTTSASDSEQTSTGTTNTTTPTTTPSPATTPSASPTTAPAVKPDNSSDNPKVTTTPGSTASPNITATPSGSTASLNTTTPGASTSPNSTTASPSTSPNSTTASPSTSPSSTTASPSTSPSSTTASPSTSPSSTTASPPTSPGSTAAPGSSTSSNSTVETSTASTPSSTAASTASPSTPGPTSSVLISETNLLVASDNLFVELKGTGSSSLNNLTLVIFNVSSAKPVFSFPYDNTSVLNSSSPLVQKINKDNVKNLRSVAVALFKPGTYDGSFIGSNVQDFVIFTLELNDISIEPRIRETCLPKNASATVVKTGPVSPNNKPLTLSRCGVVAMDNSMFILAEGTQGQPNTCHPQPDSTQLQLQLHDEKYNCKPGDDDTDVIKTELQNKLVAKINQHCACGMTHLLFISNSSLSCSRDLYLEFRFRYTFPAQAQNFTKAFVSFVSSSSTLYVNSRQFCVVNCSQNCRTKDHVKPPTSKEGNISTTVAVVLSCIAVFLLVLVAVIFYMRRKRHGVMRQFRMTRLQEDDDMDDMDDFIGGGLDQEPSFNSSRSTLTS